MVAVQAEESLQTAQRRERRRQTRPILLSGVAIVGALVASYLVGRFAWSSPDEKLIQDLPVIENLDTYLVADDVEFLKSLQREGLFPEESSDAP